MAPASLVDDVTERSKQVDDDLEHLVVVVELGDVFSHPLGAGIGVLRLDGDQTGVVVGSSSPAATTADKTSIVVTKWRRTQQTADTLTYSTVFTVVGRAPSALTTICCRPDETFSQTVMCGLEVSGVSTAGALAMEALCPVG